MSVLLLDGCCHTRPPPLFPLIKTKYKPLDLQSKPFEPALRAFFAAKEQQAKALVDGDQERVHPEIWRYFGAAARGDWREVHRLYWRLALVSNQFEESKPDERMQTPAWHPVNETFRAYEKFSLCPPRFLLLFAHEVTNAIPPGSIYFGGSDPGRFLVTFLSKSHVDGDPFFTLTQNALCDGLYIGYLREMYGDKIHVPTLEERQQAFEDYVAEAKTRLEQGTTYPDEKVNLVDSRVSVAGLGGVRGVCGNLVKTIVERNPHRECFIEPSLRLEWTYPRCAPHGFILKLNCDPLSKMSDEIVQRDRAFWKRHTTQLIGDWLTENTSLTNVMQFFERIYLRKNLSGFTGDREYVQHSRMWEHLAEHVHPCMILSASRAASGEIYLWRIWNTRSTEEQERMAREADLAFRQALALCPYNTIAIDNYVLLLQAMRRFDELLLVVDTSAKFLADKPHIPGWKKSLHDWVANQRR